MSEQEGYDLDDRSLHIATEAARKIVCTRLRMRTLQYQK